MLLNDKIINDAFRGYNFGPNANHRQLLAECVFKTMVGYSSGSSIERISKGLGLLTMKGNPSKFGKRFCYDYYNYPNLKLDYSTAK